MVFPEWQLHRGFWKQGVRENTMEAFRQAKAMECDMVELDARLSRDSVLHVFHDDSLKRFFHVEQKVSRTPSEDLTGLNIPTLEEVITSDDVPEFINIEMKSRSPIGYKEAHCLAELLEQSHHRKKILISSFNPMVLFWCRKLLGSYPRALLVDKPSLLPSRRFELYLKLSEPDYLNCHYKLIDCDTSREWLMYFSKPIMAWTVNDWEKAQDYLAKGVKSIISDSPPRSRETK